VLGTVSTPTPAGPALDAGAQYVVSPIMRPALIGIAHAAGKPVMLGSYTPTEAQLAHEAGSDFIKIFPADGLGANYIKALRAPLPHLRIVPTGGVDLNTATDFLKAGCVALGVGSSLVFGEDSAGWQLAGTNPAGARVREDSPVIPFPSLIPVHFQGTSTLFGRDNLEFRLSKSWISGWLSDCHLFAS